ncbi:hypothetical protein RND81_11G022300 [Saponaria officinalis]|uniref:S-protein homolog n=1 Tax=Saponaria officinalis TaxID=3572 RepID=A0AAW1HH22_SAPOF
MNYHHSKPFNYIFITTLLIIITITQVYGDFHFYLKNEIWRHSPVTYRCQSGSSDTGIRKLNPGQTLDYKFKMDFFSIETLYFCHFYFKRKDKVFDVYKSSIEKECAIARRRIYGPSLGDCFSYHVEWVIRKDGFYKHCVFFKNNDFFDSCVLPPMPPKSSPLQKVYSW